MKKIYTSENVKKNLFILQRRYSNMYNRKFSINQIIYAFNKLPGRYQDLLLKINKDENDKANLTKTYNMLKRELMNLKEEPENIKVIIKNINQEDEVKKTGATIEDVESDLGDRWVRPIEKEKKEIIDTNNKIVISKRKEIKEELKKVEQVEIKEPVSEEPKEEVIPEKSKSKEEVLIALNKRLKLVVLEEYIKERKKIDIESIIENIDMDDDEKFILLVKFENDSVRTNEEVSKELGITTDHIDGVVTNFYEKAIKQKNKKIYKLESE